MKSTVGPAHRLVIYTAAGCRLCEEMHEQLEPWQARPDIEIESVDISGDARLQERFRLRIPVLFVDGRELCFGKLDTDLLEEATGRC